MIFAFSELFSIAVLASKMSLVKYNVLIKKVPKPIAKINTMVWLFGRNRFNKLCRPVNPQLVGKNFLINCIKKLEIPAIIAKVIKIPTVKANPNKAFFNNQKENKNIDKEFKIIGNEGIELITNAGIDFKDFYYTQIPKHFTVLAENSKKAQFFDQNTLKRNVNDQLFYSKSKSDNVKNAIDSVLPEILNLYNKSEALFQQKTLNELILNGLIPLAVLNYIHSALQDIKAENNIMLNAEFNQLISDTIKNEPVPFIYERIGEKYRYYFIDEMQDTSELQWQNIIPLINNALASENELGERGKLLLVGDAKQSIYRWRGGKASQFIDLSSKENAQINNPFYVEKALSNLETNYRSFSEIINFNNQFFKHISGFLANTSFFDAQAAVTVDTPACLYFKAIFSSYVS